MKEKIDKNNLSIEELETLTTNLQQNMKTDVKKQIIISFILTIIILVIITVTISLKLNNTINVKPYFEGDTPAILILVLALTVGVIGYLNLFIQSRKGNGRTLINVNLSADNKDIKEKMDNILKNLYYVEKTYRGSKVYFAFKDRYTLDARSKSRYISYSIDNSELIIEAWICIMGRELPIDKKRIADISKRALACDLQYIINNINN